MMQRIFAVLAILFLSGSLYGQTMFDAPFDLTRSHIDVEIHHPAVVKGKSSLSLYEGMYLIRGVIPVDDYFQIAAEQSFGSWNVPGIGETFNDNMVGNTVITGSFLLDTVDRYQIRTSLAFSLLNDGAERNLIADPWHVYRSLNHMLAVIVEGSGDWHLTPEFYAGAAAGLEFYKYTGDDSVTDDPSGYITLMAGGGYIATKVSFGIALRTMYYTGQTFGMSPFTNALNLQVGLRSGIRPTLTAEIPLDSYLSNLVALTFNLRISMPLGKQ